MGFLGGKIPLGEATRRKGWQGTGVLEMPLGQGCEGTLTLRSGGGRLSKCSELTVGNSKSLVWVNRSLL